MAEQMLQQQFRKDPPIVVSYSFADLLSNNSYVTLYGGFVTRQPQVYESYTTGEDGNTLTSDAANKLIAQTFTVGTTGTNEDFYLDKIILKGQGTEGFSVSIQTVDVNGKPSGTKLIEWVGATHPYWIDAGAIRTYYILLSNATNIVQSKLSAGTKYAIVVVYGGNSILLREDATAASYTGGTLYESTDTGATWTEQVNEDVIFNIYGSENPYVLLPLTFTTAKASTTLTKATTAATLTDIGNLDFSSKINIAGTLNGTAIIETLVSVAVGVEFYNYSVKLIRVRNSTETEIASCSSRSITTICMNIENFPVNIGDEIILRITPQYIDSSGGASFTINHNPESAGYEVLLKLPFKTDN